MNYSKQHVINHYVKNMKDSIAITFQKPNEIIDDLKLPPMVEADWDTNDTKEFDRLLNEILFEKRVLH